ncbi:hypothetical protein AB1Y20_000065 [Prymnesium parvum]|uniref:Uncharacterized protein n=1 Tax=Prymnesium parvum TaxID=97485 RepID=A0AB34K8W5_PRYPA
MPPRTADGRSLLLVALLFAPSRASHSAAFVGPFAPRVRSRAPPPPPPPPVGGGLTHDEVRSLLRGRHALVLAGEDDAHALHVAASLAEVGAAVIVGCERPQRAARECSRISRACREEAAREGGGGAPAGYAEARQLDLSCAAEVWRFAEALLAEERPLHVVVSCADDVAPWYRPGGWEGTIGRTHLGPFLLTQLLLDRMVATMRRDAQAYAQQCARQQTAAAGKGAERRDEPTAELHARPYPAPLGRVVTLGLKARLSPRHPNPVAGLQLQQANFTSWRAYRAAHEANLLSFLQLAKFLKAAALPSGDFVEVSVVRPGGGRWLPRPLRRLFHTHHGAALTASFLASTPVMGMTEIYFDDFASQPPWSKSGRSLSAASAMKETFLASLRLSGAPPVEWQSEAALTSRGAKARSRPRPARIRGSSLAEMGPYLQEP